MDPRRSLKQRLQWELALKSPTASLAFCSVAAVVLFSPFGTVSLASWVRVGAAICFVASAFRYILARRIQRRGPRRADEGADPARLQATVIVNALGWGLVFGAVTWERLPLGAQLYLPFAVMTGFATASLITLSSHVKLSLTFALSTFGVQFALLTYLQLSGRMPFDYPLLTVFFVFACFVVRQAYDLRAHMIARFRSEIRMEISNALLRESRQRELEQTAQAVHASRLASLGEMAGGIAHEINNPLAIISTSLEVMELGMQRAGMQAPEASAESMARIHRAIARIARIVRGLRKLSRTSEQDAKEDTTMSRVLTDTMDLCTEKFLSHQIRFEARGFEEEVRIPCRPIEISQILINLLNNAFDAVKNLPEKDRVITLTQSVREKEICLRVENGGPRIGEWGKNRLFQPFFTTKEVGLGTGLGLSISRALAINHQGTLEFDDTAEQTSFVLSLPRT